MKFDRRDFIKKTALVSGGLSLLPRIGFAQPEPNPEPLDEQDFWNHVRESYTVSGNIINLNNGGVSPQPKPVQEAHIRYYQYANEGPSYFMWRILDQGREPLREKIAKLAGADAEEVAINRNATEGLNSIIFGLNLQRGDEVVLCRYDYPNMMNAWKQREKREGIKLVWIDMMFPLEDDEKIIALYANAITPKTKIIHLTHLINWTGQILPAKKIIKMAHEKGCKVILDGAHSFAHIEFNLHDLDCDFFATSLHKWLCAPFGSGFMYIKKQQIKDVWSLLSNDHPDGDDIRKFESIGTRSFASEMAIAQAIDFHESIGSKRKAERLFFLKNYWAEKISALKGFKLSTSLKPEYSCAIAHVGLEGWKGAEMESKLFEKFKIHTVGIDMIDLKGIRITPHVYTSTADLDKLVEGLKYLQNIAPPAR
jgi:selenocysteine lyase/cysteine desulfurase